MSKKEQSATRISGLFTLYVSASDLAESSAAIKKRALGFFVKAFGDCKADSVDYGRAEDFKNCLTKGRSRESANIYLKNFKPFFGWLVKRGFIKQNPFDQLTMFKCGEKKRDLYTAEEIERIIRVCDDRWKAIVLLALCSLRRAEVLNLTVAEIHFDKSYILITPKKDTEQTWQWEIKNHNQAIVPLPETITLPDMTVNLHQLLISLIEKLPPQQPYVCLRSAHFENVMRHRQRDTVTFEMRNCPGGNFDRDFYAILKRAKVRRKRFHDLRATFATEMAKHMTLTETQKLMRHSSPNTTAKYYIRTDEQRLIAKANETAKICYASNVP